MKTKYDKKVNQSARKLNKQLRNDVFQDRFSVVQKRKQGLEYCHEYHVYLYEFLDKKCPERNFEKLLTESEILISSKLFELMNEFIITSDFWKTFDKKAFFKDKVMCFTCHEYVPYSVKMTKLVAKEYTSNKTLEFYGEAAFCKRCKKPISTSCVDEIKERNIVRVRKLNANFKCDYFQVKEGNKQ